MLQPPDAGRDPIVLKSQYRGQQQRMRAFHQTSLTPGQVVISTQDANKSSSRHRKKRSTDDIERGVLKKRPSEESGHLKPFMKLVVQSIETSPDYTNEPSEEFYDAESIDPLHRYDERMFSSRESNVCSSFSEHFMFTTKQSGWRALNELGHGANGTVWRVMREDTGAMAAMKVISRTNQTDRSVEKVHREIAMLKKMDHVNIVKYLDSEITEYDFRIYMELVSGGTLYNLLGHKKLEGRLVEKFTKQIARGLEYLHTQNVVHRDIKSANVLVGAQGICKLADFGASIQMQGSIDCSQMNPSLQGTPLYMPPEITQGQKYGKKSDIWSFGITVFEMLTGHPPFYENIQGARTVVEQYARICFRFAQAQNPIDLDQFEDEEIRDFLAGCFPLDRKQRVSIEDLLDHDWLNRKNHSTSIKKPFTRSRPTVVENKTTCESLKVPCKSVWFWLMLVCFVVLCAISIWLVFRVQSENPSKNNAEPVEAYSQNERNHEGDQGSGEYSLLYPKDPESNKEGVKPIDADNVAILKPPTSLEIPLRKKTEDFEDYHDFKMHKRTLDYTSSEQNDTVRIDRSGMDQTLE